MARYSSVKRLGVLGLLLSGTAAHADVTAQQVWENWADQMAIYGEGFTTSGETVSGDTLTIADVKIVMTDDEAIVTSAIGDINLTENGDGTVSITMAESYPITIDLTPEYGDPSAINLTVNQTGMILNVSGDPEAMTYDIAADSYAISVDSLDGEAAEEVTLKDATLAATDLSGQYSVNEDDMTRITSQMSVGAIDLDLLFTEKGGEGVVSANLDIADIAGFGNYAQPLDFELDLDADMPPFDEGLAIDGGYSIGKVSVDFNIDADGEAASGSATVESTELGVSFDYDEFTYTGNAQGIDLSMLVPNELPFPIEAAMARYGFDFQIPLSQGEDGPRDARFALNFTDLAVSNGIWNLLDPGEILPREAMTIALAMNAQVTPFFDLLDPSQQEALMMTDVPGELNSVELTDLTVRGAGAEITGAGAFTFDNSDLESFDGFPRPEGKVDFAINGVNGLVDKLIEMGIIPAEEAMMPRMMMGMFATPVGDDMLTSTIEVNSEGHVLANGQRLR